MSIADLARPEIRALNPYAAAIQVKDTVRLNANEAPWTSSADRFRRPLNRYPEIRPARVRDALAERYGCRPDNLLVTRGSSEAIDLLVRAFCRSGVDNVVTAGPTFSMYRHYAAVQGAGYHEVPTSRGGNFAVDADALLAACDANTRLVFLCSPNNPTATLTDGSTLERILAACQGKAIVVMDEAYIEFANAPSAIPRLADYDNLVVLRTLSKALAFAGARCGSAIGHTDVIAVLNAVQAPYAIATPVVECVEEALSSDALTIAEQSVNDLIQRREQLIECLESLPFVNRIWPSAANFFLMAVNDADSVMQQTGQDKILLRHFGGDLADCVRVTVGSEAENQTLLNSLQTLGDPD